MSKTTAFLNGLVHHSQMESIEEGLRAAIREYYDDYTDADTLDHEFWRAVKAIGAYGWTDPEDLIEEVQAAITSETGRKFRTD